MKTKSLNLFSCTTIALLLFSTFSYAQVGIGTTDPQETLHVNGTLRITTTDQASINTIKIGGLDANGTYREISIGQNIALRENVLSATSAPTYTFGSISFTVQNNHNVDLMLEPGEANHGVNIIRIYSVNSSPRISGIKAGVDGQVIWLYPQPGVEIELQPNNNNSSAANRILNSSHKNADDYEMIQLLYDGVRQRWILMKWHSN